MNEEERWIAATEHVHARRLVGRGGPEGIIDVPPGVDELRGSAGWMIGGTACVRTARERDAVVALAMWTPSAEDARVALAALVAARAERPAAWTALLTALSLMNGPVEFLTAFVERGFVPPRDLHAAASALLMGRVSISALGDAVRCGGASAEHLAAALDYVGPESRLEFVRSRVDGPRPRRRAGEAPAPAWTAADAVAVLTVLRRCSRADVLCASLACSSRMSDGACACEAAEPNAHALVTWWLVADAPSAAERGAMFDGRAGARSCSRDEMRRDAARAYAFATAAQSRLSRRSAAGAFAASDGDTSLRRRVASFLVDGWSERAAHKRVRLYHQRVLVYADGTVRVGVSRRVAASTGLVLERAPRVDAPAVWRWLEAVSVRVGLVSAVTDAAAEVAEAGHSVTCDDENRHAVALNPDHPYAAAANDFEDAVETATAMAAVDPHEVALYDAAAAARLARARAFAAVAPDGRAAPDQETERAVQRVLDAVRERGPAEENTVRARAARLRGRAGAEQIFSRAVCINALARLGRLDDADASDASDD